MQTFIGIIFLLWFIGLTALGAVLVVKFLGWILFGAVAGYLASWIMGEENGFWRNSFLGLIGSLVGGLVFHVLDFKVSGGFFYDILVSSFGAILVIFVSNLRRK